MLAAAIIVAKQLFVGSLQQWLLPRLVPAASHASLGVGWVEGAHGSHQAGACNCSCCRLPPKTLCRQLSAVAVARPQTGYCSLPAVALWVYNSLVFHVPPHFFFLPLPLPLSLPSLCPSFVSCVLHTCLSCTCMSCCS